MFELILMRHAKSDWNNDLSDKDRPLNNRGIKDATQMGIYLAEFDLVPDTILISSAERTRQTASLMLENFSVDAEQLIICDELYLASPATMIDLIKNHAREKQRLMLLAHNPGMDEMVIYLSTSSPELTASGKLMVTCAAAVFRLDAIEDLDHSGRGTLQQIIRPREIY